MQRLSSDELEASGAPGVERSQASECRFYPLWVLTLVGILAQSVCGEKTPPASTHFVPARNQLFQPRTNNKDGQQANGGNSSIRSRRGILDLSESSLRSERTARRTVEISTRYQPADTRDNWFSCRRQPSNLGVHGFSGIARFGELRAVTRDGVDAETDLPWSAFPSSALGLVKATALRQESQCCGIGEVKWKGRNYNGKSRDQKVRAHTVPV
jgi:hypothetical protein